MILQEEKHLENFYGILRDIFYFPSEKTIEVHFYMILNNDFNFVFKKSYKSEDEMFMEIQDFIKKERVITHRIGSSEEDLKKVENGFKKFVQAIIKKDIELPKGFEYQGDISHLKRYI